MYFDVGKYEFVILESGECWFIFCYKWRVYGIYVYGIGAIVLNRSQEPTVSD